MKTFFAAILGLMLAASAHAQTCPDRSQEFKDKLGINGHLTWGGPWSESAVAADMTYLGFQYLRDGVFNNAPVADEFVALAQRGIHFDYVQGVNPAGQPDFSNDLYWMNYIIQRSTPNAIVSEEGANEYNISSYNLNGVSSLNNLAWGALDNVATINALMTTLATQRINYLAASVAGYDSIPSVEGTADEGNWHPYAANGQQLGDNIRGAVPKGEASVGGGPMEVTETGTSSVAPWLTTWGCACDERTQAIIDMNAAFEAIADGARRTYFQNLIENAYTDKSEDHFGFFRPDGSPKPVAVGFHNLMSIMADPGSNAETFQTVALSPYVVPLPAGAFYRVFQKSSGAYDIIIWNGEATVWKGNDENYVPPVPVRVGFSQTFSSIKVFDPLVSDQPISTPPATTEITVSVGADPVIVEIASPMTPVQSATLCATDWIDVLASGTYYGGYAMFKMSVDGVSTGVTYTITADHNAGAWQHIYAAGNWGPGPHNIALSFINDAYGGDAAHDRNAYFKSVGYNGVLSRLGNIALVSEGTTVFPTNF